MAYETELMREILKSESGRKMIQEITPRYGDAYAFLWLIETMGRELDRAVQYAKEFADQTAPQTATWALDYWEKEYGIIPEKTWSVNKRRDVLLSQMRSGGAMNPKRMEQTVSAITGLDTRLVENTAKNTFTLYISGDPNSVNETEIKAAVDKAKPARLVYLLRYEKTITAAQFYAGTINYIRTVNLKQR